MHRFSFCLMLLAITLMISEVAEGINRDDKGGFDQTKGESRKSNTSLEGKNRDHKGGFDETKGESRKSNASLEEKRNKTKHKPAKKPKDNLDNKDQNLYCTCGLKKGKGKLFDVSKPNCKCKHKDIKKSNRRLKISLEVVDKVFQKIAEKFEKSDIKKLEIRGNRKTVLCRFSEEDFIEPLKILFNHSKNPEIEYNSICGRNITVAYSILFPYVHEAADGTVIGLIPDLLYQGLVRRCCLDNNHLQFVKKGSQQKFEEQHNENKSVDIVIPAELKTEKGLSDFGEDFGRLMSIKCVYFVAKTRRPSQMKTLHNIVSSVLNTYPLFVVAMVMTLCAGTFVWLLEHWNNYAEFPAKFPHGMIEGFWWAFISMTTVGYGDKTPKSYIARAFAVVWICIGITIFGIYVATLTTSIVTMELTDFGLTLQNKPVGMIKGTKYPKRVIKQYLGNAIEYDNMTLLIDALHKEEIHAIAVDETTYAYEAKYIKKNNAAFKVQLTVDLTSHIGFTTQDPTILEMNEVFLERYMGDVRTNIKQEEEEEAEEEEEEDISQYVLELFSASNKVFVKVVVIILVCTAVMAVLGILLIGFNKGSRYLVNRNDTQKSFLEKNRNYSI